jgi:hypothetical protein
MSEGKLDRWNRDLVAFGTGAALGGFTAAFFSSMLTGYLYSLSVDTYLEVLGGCVLAFLAGCIQRFPLRHLVQLLAGAVLTVALVGLVVSRMP